MHVACIWEQSYESLIFHLLLFRSMWFCLSPSRVVNVNITHNEIEKILNHTPSQVHSTVSTVHGQYSYNRTLLCHLMQVFPPRIIEAWIKSAASEAKEVYQGVWHFKKFMSIDQTTPSVNTHYFRLLMWDHGCSHMFVYINSRNEYHKGLIITIPDVSLKGSHQHVFGELFLQQARTSPVSMI